MRGIEATLYSMSISHPARAGGLMLRHKGIEARRRGTERGRFQIAATSRVLFNFSQLRPLLEGRPVADHAHRVIPNFGRELDVALPPEWVPG